MILEFMNFNNNSNRPKVVKFNHIVIQIHLIIIICKLSKNEYCIKLVKFTCVKNTHSISVMPKSIQFSIVALVTFSTNMILWGATVAYASATLKMRSKLSKTQTTHPELRQVIGVRSHLRDLKERFQP